MFGTIVKLFATFLISLILTPLVKLLAFRIGAVDQPGERRINETVMPTMGGFAIYLAFVFSCLVFFKNIISFDYIFPIILGATVVMLTGLVDDVKPLSPRMKMLGILVGALIIYFVADIRMDSFVLPFVGEIQLGKWSLVFTILWIAAITNAINLIDGLDGLASGVSMIALFTIGVIGYFFLHPSTTYISIVMFVLVASIAGFFPYNFFPAKIFLGDTGALFLGFMISVLSLQSLKNATFISLITPLIILGVPITDTVFAMIRRLMNKKPITSADKMHLHHRLLSLGFTHRGAVLTIYGIAFIFSFLALLYTYTNRLGSIFLTIGLLFGLELFVELIGLTGTSYQPLLYCLRLFGNKEFRDNEYKKHQEKRKSKLK